MTLEMAVIVRFTRNAGRILVSVRLAARRNSNPSWIRNHSGLGIMRELVHVKQVRRSECVPCGEEVTKDAAEDDGDDNVAVVGHGNQHDQVLLQQCK